MKKGKKAKRGPAPRPPGVPAREPFATVRVAFWHRPGEVGPADRVLEDFCWIEWGDVSTEGDLGRGLSEEPAALGSGVATLDGLFLGMAAAAALKAMRHSEKIAKDKGAPPWARLGPWLAGRGEGGGDG